MKLPFKKPDPSKPRPYWHVDAKWVCALLLIAALAITLPVAAAHRLTARGPATEIIAYTMAGFTSPGGLDSEDGLGDIRARVAAKGSETITIGGVDVTFTAKDMETLSPRELRLKVFRTYANSFYTQGVKELAASQGLDQAAIDKAENDAFLLKGFNTEAHERVGKILTWMIVADLFLIALLAFFSWRFGRLASPGLVLFLAGLPGVPLAIAAHQHPEVGDIAREGVSNYGQAASSFASYVAPLVVPHFAAVYMFALKSGAILLAAALLGRIVYTFVQKRGGKAPGREPKDEAKKDDGKDDKKN